MPSFKIAGKSKEDLAIIAQLAGLLSSEDTAKMTRTELVRLLEKENRKSEATVQAEATAPVRSKRPARIKKAPSETVIAAETVIEPATDPVQESALTKPVKSRAVRSKKNAEVNGLTLETIPVIAEPAMTEPVVRTRTRKSTAVQKPRGIPQQEVISTPVEPLAEATSPVAETAENQTASETTKLKPRKKSPKKVSSEAESVPESLQLPEPVPVPVAEPAVEVVDVAPIAQESLKPASRTKGQRKINTIIDLPPVEAAASASSTVVADDTSTVASTNANNRPGRPSGRKNRKQIELPVLAESAPTQESTSIQAPVIAQTPETVQEMAPEKSPEASEAASDNSPSSPAEAHRVPPHHTLSQNRPGQRRTRVIGNPDESDSQASAERPTETQSHYGRSPSMTNRPSGRPPAPGTSSRPGFRPYPQSTGQESDMLNRPVENRPVSNPETTAETAAESAAMSAPGLQGTETDTARTQRPIVETGDIQAGVLEIMPDGYGFLRKENYLQGTKDIYVPPQYIRRFGLRQGDYITGPVKLQRESDRYQALLYIKDVNGMAPEKMLRRPHFDKLTPIYPDNRFILETVRNELSTRIIDLVAPIGKGQRGMIVSPPKAGKTIILQKIANAISTNNPDVKLIVLLIDERPEEVTDMQRSINGEVVYSTFDKTPENHTKVTELVLERAMRLVELKQDVVILLDSMTRLARAYNLTINPTGRTLSGGLDPGALYGPKRFFGAARNIENGGSLTIIATSLIETGSRMDEVIFEEFKGTGNMEVYLDRKMSEKRIFPAIDINKSGTRREELLMTSKELDAVWTIRKAFSQLDTTSVTEAIINLLLKTKNNEHFISSVNVSFNDKNVFEAMRGVRPQDAAQQNPAPAARGGSGYSGNSYNNTGYNNYRRPPASDDD